MSGGALAGGLGRRLGARFEPKDPQKIIYNVLKERLSTPLSSFLTKRMADRFPALEGELKEVDWEFAFKT